MSFVNGEWMDRIERNERKRGCRHLHFVTFLRFIIDALESFYGEIFEGDISTSNGLMQQNKFAHIGSRCLPIYDYTIPLFDQTPDKRLAR